MRYSGFQMLLEDRARQTPEAPALAYAQHGERTVCSFAELRQRVQVRAETLRGEDKRAYGILADGSFDCVIEIFAAVLAGRRTVLLSENAAEETLIASAIAASDAPGMIFKWTYPRNPIRRTICTVSRSCSIVPSGDLNRPEDKNSPSTLPERQ